MNVGDSLYFTVSDAGTIVLREAKVIRIGRLYIYLREVSNTKLVGTEFKANRDGTVLLNRLNCMGKRLYTGPNHYELEKRRDKMWSLIKANINRTYNPPAGVDVDAVAKLLGIT